MPKQVIVNSTPAHEARHTAVTDPLWTQVEGRSAVELEIWLSELSVDEQRRLMISLIIALRHFMTQEKTTMRN